MRMWSVASWRFTAWMLYLLPGSCGVNGFVALKLSSRQSQQARVTYKRRLPFSTTTTIKTDVTTTFPLKSTVTGQKRDEHGDSATATGSVLVAPDTREGETNSSNIEGANTPTTAEDDTSAASNAAASNPPSLISSLLSKSSSDEQQPLTEEPSDQRYSADDWFHNIQSLPGSLILRTIRGPVLAVTVWTAIVSIVYEVLKHTKPAAAARLCLSDKPHSFLASALGLLLVFRTNSAYQRFAEARAIWERILSVSRNMSRMALLFEKDLGADRLQRILRLLATFPYMLDEHINTVDEPQEQAQLKALYEETSSSSSSSASHSSNSGSTTSQDVLAVPRHVYRRERGVQRQVVGSIKIQYIDTRKLPWCLLPDATRRRCAVAENRPLFICDRLAREVFRTRLTTNFTHRERSTLLAMIDALSSSMGACERIHQTAVPLNYARHALRCVALWLFSLPVALLKDLGLATAPVVMCVAWVYFGIYQIGYTIEDPFQSALRLDTLCDTIYRNVMFGTASMRRRLAALDRNMGETDADWRNLPLPPPIVARSTTTTGSPSSKSDSDK